MTFMLQAQRDRTLFLWCTLISTNSKENDMSLNSHLTELKRKHKSLSERVEMAQRTPAVDGLHIAEMKKQKLKLKEEIERLSA
jgi:hypothetical protein